VDREADGVGARLLHRLPSGRLPLSCLGLSTDRLPPGAMHTQHAEGVRTVCVHIMRGLGVRELARAEAVIRARGGGGSGGLWRGRRRTVGGRRRRNSLIL
jgi:hypothetical protein